MEHPVAVAPVAVSIDVRSNAELTFPVICDSLNPSGAHEPTLPDISECPVAPLAAGEGGGPVFRLARLGDRTTTA
jgi:hypothetical protein